MRVLAIIHQEDTGPGVFGDVIRERGLELDEWRPLGGEPAPDPGEHGAVISLGGAMNVGDELPELGLERDVLAELLGREIPLFGVCLGAQVLAAAAGAAVTRASEPEIGWYRIEMAATAAEDPVFSVLPQSFEAFEWHSYEAQTPDGAVELAHSSVCPQALRVGERAWGIQFHAEVSAEIVDGWIRDYRTDPDAIAMSLDPEALREETRAKIGAWNELGRRLCGAFLDAATDPA
jgi:GMP synthase-like glutamine amidotransferase